MERMKASDFPQDLLNLFDKYVHGDIDRRAFLDGAQKFAVGGLTAMGILEALRPNYAWAQQVPKDDKRINTETVTVPSPQGNTEIKGYSSALPAPPASCRAFWWSMKTAASTLILRMSRAAWASPATWLSLPTGSPAWAASPATTKKARRPSAKWMAPK